MHERDDPIDIVLTWVDDSDADWLSLRNSYSDTPQDYEAAIDQRFRDWGLLRHWFRGVEQNMPWARRIHLVTENPLPQWLHDEHPRLRVHRHRDFIPEQYLPTFNSRAIEWNLFRLPGLSEHFVYFNDDTFAVRPVPVTHFFRGSQPRAFAVMNALSVGDNVSHAMLNNVEVLNRHFSKHRVMRGSLGKWLHPSYGLRALQNVALAPWKRFTGFHNHHLPFAMRKSTVRAIWSAEHDAIDATCYSRFRAFSDVNPFLISWWEVCSGDFAPAHVSKYGKYFQLTRDNSDDIAASIRSGSHRVICLNDGPVDDFEAARAHVLDTFDALLPKKSTYER